MEFEQIEAGHHRTAAVLLSDVRHSAARFAAAYKRMPAEAWATPLRWTSGKERPAYRAADARLTEVLVHHVDLRAGFVPDHWPEDFVSATLADVTSAFAARERVPDLHLVALDTGADYRLGAPDTALLVRGRQASLLAWLLGRSDDAELADSLPTLPFLYWLTPHDGA